MQLKIGDRVDCLVKESVIIHPSNTDHDEVMTLEIIALARAGYHLYVPSYRFIKHSVALSELFCRKLNAKSCFIGEQIVTIADDLVFKINTIYDGCFCARCHEFYNMSAPNQENGNMICWRCRDNPY